MMQLISSQRYQKHSALLLLPYLIGASLLIVIPLILSLILAFFTYDGLSTPVWAGWANFRDVWREPLFRVALLNSVKFIYLAVPLRLLAALGLALLFSRPRRGTGVFRAMVYLPTIVPEAAYALLWLWILNPLYGPLNQILNFLGLATPAWLVNEKTALPALVMMTLFTIGEGFVVLLAALKFTSPEIYEAAWVDGSGHGSAFFYITLPLLKPWLILLLVRDVILAFQATFTPAYLMTGGGPYYATLFLPMLAFEESFDGLRFGAGSVIVLLIITCTLGLLALLFLLFQEWGYEEP